jgi:hypothetical protein
MFQNKLTIYRVNLPSYTHKIIKYLRYVVLRSQDWEILGIRHRAWAPSDVAHSLSFLRRQHVPGLLIVYISITYRLDQHIS